MVARLRKSIEHEILMDGWCWKCGMEGGGRREDSWLGRNWEGSG